MGRLDPFVRITSRETGARVFGPKLRRLLGRRARRRYDAGRTLRLPASIRGSEPFPRRAYGRLVLTPSSVTFRIWHRLGRPVPLTGLTFRHTRHEDRGVQQPPLTWFVFADATGQPLEVSVYEQYADVLRSALDRTAAAAFIV